MKWITADFMRSDFGYSPDADPQETTDTQFDFFIQRATSRINVITKREVEQGITNGDYILENGIIIVNNLVVTDPATFLEETKRIDAVKEALGILTKFGLDTGYDFLTGSFSANIGSESWSDTMDFDASLSRIERQINELLAAYDWGTVLSSAKSINVALDNDLIDMKSIDGEDRPITQMQYNTLHENTHVAKNGGGIIITTDPGSKPGYVFFEVDPAAVSGNLSVEDAELIITESKIVELNKKYDEDINT